jgi:hypothetical protein
MEVSQVVFYPTSIWVTCEYLLSLSPPKNVLLSGQAVEFYLTNWGNYIQKPRQQCVYVTRTRDHARRIRWRMCTRPACVPNAAPRIERRC